LDQNKFIIIIVFYLFNFGMLIVN